MDMQLVQISPIEGGKFYTVTAYEDASALRYVTFTCEDNHGATMIRDAIREHADRITVTMLDKV